MSFERIISIAGKSGLFEILSQNKNNLVVKSLEDDKKMPVYASHKVSALSDISIYTMEDEIPLKEVYNLMSEKMGDVVIDKSTKPEEMRAKFSEIVPDYDADRVYNSDLKKIFSWFNLLTKSKIDFAAEEEKENTEETTEEAK